MRYINEISNNLNSERIFLTDVLPTNYDSNYLNMISRNKNNYFLQFNFNKNLSNLPHQGFKIHISATLNNYQMVLDLIYDYCRTQNLCFKYISNLENIQKNLSGNGKIWSSGKFITIYPSNFKEFKKNIESIYQLDYLKKLQGIEILSDRKYKNSNNIYYRYGVITGPDTKIYNPSNNNEYYLDYKKTLYYLPSWIKEPFPDNIDDTKNSKILFKKYFPIKALNNKASGSTFIIKDKENHKFILKNAKFGFMDSNNDNTAISLLKNEAKNLKQFNDFDFLPNYKDDFFEDKDYFLVETLKKGKDVDSFRADTRNNFYDPAKRLKTLLRYRAIVIDLLRKVIKLHDNGIFLGDISAKNTMINMDTNSVSFIDLAQTNLIKNITQKYSFYRTIGFFDNKTPYLNLKRQDEQQLGYLVISMFTRANMFLKIDKSGYMSYRFFKKYISTYDIPEVYSFIVKELLFSRHVNLKNILNHMLNYKQFNKIFLVHEEKGDFKTILDSANRAINVSKIDGIIDNDNLLNQIDNKKDFIFDNYLSKIRYSYLLMNHIELTQENIKKLFSELNKLKYLLDNIKSNVSIQKVNFSNILSLIYCCIQNIKTSHQKEEVKYVLTIIQEIYGVSDKRTFLGYKMNFNSFYLSPYLDDGTAGMLVNLLTYKKITNDNSFNSTIKQLAENLKMIFMPKNASFSKGLLGIIFALNFYCKVFYDDKEIKRNITIMANRLPYYCLKTNNVAYLVAPSFDKIALNYTDGNLGLVEVLKNIS